MATPFPAATMDGSGHYNRLTVIPKICKSNLRTIRSETHLVGSLVEYNSLQWHGFGHLRPANRQDFHSFCAMVQGPAPFRAGKAT